MENRFQIIHPYSRRGRLNVQRELAKAGLLGVKALNSIMCRGSFGGVAAGGGGGAITVVSVTATLFDNHATWTFSEPITSDGTPPPQLEAQSGPNAFIWYSPFAITSGDGTAVWHVAYLAAFYGGSNGEGWRITSAPTHLIGGAGALFTVPESGTIL